MWWDEGHKWTVSLPPSNNLLPTSHCGMHGCVLQWQVPEMHPDHPNPSSHIHSGSDNRWCAGSFPASAFIHSGIRVSLFVLVKRGGRAGCPRQVYTARWRDPKQGPCTNNIKHFRAEKAGFQGWDHTWTLLSYSQQWNQAGLKGVECPKNYLPT